MNKYEILLNVLDHLRSEAPTQNKTYHPDLTNYEGLNQARARAFIHLFLKVRFGLLKFQEREAYITDGISDAGIDGYYINAENKIIYFIQSKFRTTKENFETKAIKVEEFLAMDISRILNGEDCYENGVSYNSKIQDLKRRIASIEDIGRYRYKVIILANVGKLTDAQLKMLTGGFLTEVVDFEKSYGTLVFPVVSGTYYNESALNINIDLSNKNAGAKISYSVETKLKKCEITVLFVPTIEIAKIMYKYKNSILKYNPRCYLDLEGKNVNAAIRETIEKSSTNEFALFNNGITMLSDETYINERIGKKGRAQLTVINPQILNGGQTAFTLSRIYEENSEDKHQHLFENKEVLLKIITFEDSDTIDDSKKLQLIEDISRATNQQSTVTYADRRSNDQNLINLQNIIFERYGILLERKRGEFSDGLRSGYIKQKNIIERSLFVKVCVAVQGNLTGQGYKRIFRTVDFSSLSYTDTSKLDLYYYGILCYYELLSNQKISSKKSNDIHRHHYTWMYVMSKFYRPNSINDYENKASLSLREVEKVWENFTDYVANCKHNSIYIKKVKVLDSDEQKQVFNFHGYVTSSRDLLSDIDDFFKLLEKPDWVIKDTGC